MLRLPRLTVERPATVDEALVRLQALGPRGRVLAGGTDLLVNLKHRVVEAETLLSLDAIGALRGLERTPDGGLRIGAMTPLADVATSPDVQERAPALASAAGQISSPQLRRMGTLGGNVLLDTRCRWINQTHFWRQALGFCLKKDGTVCHVVEGGKRCVAAASNDTAPALLTLDATLELRGPDGARALPLRDLYRADGAAHLALRPAELLLAILVPPQPPGHRGAYVKLRSRGAIDFPLLGVAATVVLDGETIRAASVAAVALQARPLQLEGVSERLAGLRRGTPELTAALEALGGAAQKKLRPLANVPGDAAWRQQLVAVFVKRALRAALGAP